MKELLGKTLGNYHLQRIIGRGRMGVVFLAQDRALLRPTALKLLAWTMENDNAQDPVKWFLSEARSVARISHPNVIQIYNIAKHGEHRYIAMEYVDGESLEQLLLKNSRFSVRRATDILLQTSAALEAAHRCGVVHRDIKPANILLRSDGIVKLSDFGMALSNYRDAVLTAAMRVGTPYFNAPETWEGRPASPASDIYALGVTYYLLLTGKLPFEAKNMHELQWKHIHETIPDPRQHVKKLPALCKEITDTCLAKNPHHRCSSAHELAVAAKNLLNYLKQDQTRKSYPPPPSTASQLQKGYESAVEPWSKALAFSIKPFSSADPLNLPYNGPPFTSAMKAVNDTLAKNTKLIMIHGEAGSGRTTLCRQHVLQSRTKYRAVYISAKGVKSSFLPFHSLCRTAGLDPDQFAVEDMLTDWLSSSEKGAEYSGSIVYLDEFPEDEASIEAIIEFISFIKRIGGCSVVTVSTTRTVSKLRARTKGMKSANIKLRPLKPREVVNYIREWIRKALLPIAPLLLISTDASLLAAYFSKGNLTRINRIARNILRVGALTEKRVISTWEVWNARHLEENADISPAAFPSRPETWPPPEITEILNEYRHLAGFSPICKVEKVSESAAAEKEEQHE